MSKLDAPTERCEGGTPRDGQKLSFVFLVMVSGYIQPPRTEGDSVYAQDTKVTFPSMTHVASEPARNLRDHQADPSMGEQTMHSYIRCCSSTASALTGHADQEPTLLSSQNSWSLEKKHKLG